MQWKVLLGDFGLCQVISETNVIGTRTMLAGSSGFQSPEQLRNESIGIPSDVYALGAVALVVFVEKPVWPGLSPYQIMFQVTVSNAKPNTSLLPPPIKMNLVWIMYLAGQLLRMFLSACCSNDIYIAAFIYICIIILRTCHIHVTLMSYKIYCLHVISKSASYFSLNQCHKFSIEAYCILYSDWELQFMLHHERTSCL